MKVKIKENISLLNAKYEYVNGENIFTLKITDKYKWLILPVKIIPVKIAGSEIKYNLHPLLVFYDGDTGGVDHNYDIRAMDGRREFAPYEMMGGKYMPFIQLTDPYYLWRYDQYDGIPGVTTGWAGGLTASGSLRRGEGYNTNAFNYVTSREILGLRRSLALQGVTTDDVKYIYLNWTEDYRDIGGFGFGTMTGPADTVNIINTGGVTFEQPRGLISEDNQGRTVRQNLTELAFTIAKIFDGGTGTDGVYFQGLRHYFPNCKFGVYNWPPWAYYFSDGTNNASVSNINDKINFFADAWIKGLSGAIDSFDMWMPSFYCALNSREMNRLRSIQGISACNKINEMLEASGKSKKLIVPFVWPFWYTIATGEPYADAIYNGLQYRYTPPNTVMSDEDMSYQQLEPIVAGGGNGATVWQGTSYLKLQILGRATNGLYEDVAPQANWRKWMFKHPGGTTAGVNQWSSKTMWRQAISAHYNYTRGVCLGITGNRWWWATASKTTTPGPAEQYTPPEWLPLGLSLSPYGNKVKYYNGSGDAGATSSYETQKIVEYILEDAKIRAINNFKTLWEEKYPPA